MDGEGDGSDGALPTAWGGAEGARLGVSEAHCFEDKQFTKQRRAIPMRLVTLVTAADLMRGAGPDNARRSGPAEGEASDHWLVLSGGSHPEAASGGRNGRKHTSLLEGAGDRRRIIFFFSGETHQETNGEPRATVNREPDVNRVAERPNGRKR